MWFCIKQNMNVIWHAFKCLNRKITILKIGFRIISEGSF